MRASFEKYIGASASHNGVEHTVRSFISDRGVVELMTDDGEVRDISYGEFRAKISNGLVVKFGNGASTDAYIPDPHARAEMRFRHKLLTMNEELERMGMPFAARHGMMSRKFQDDPDFITARIRFPGKSTIYSWKRKFKDKGMSGLIPKHDRKGNFTPRCDYEFEEIVLDLIDSFFERSDVTTVPALAVLARDRYLNFCKETGREPEAHGERVVRTIMRTLSWRDVTKRRLGEEDGRQRTLVAEQIVNVEMPLDRVEIDCTTADIFVVDEWGNIIGRPTICAVIDAATGAILALQVTLAPPSSSLIVRSLKEMLSPKPEEFFETMGIKNRFQAYGSPLKIVSDQGPENGHDVLEAFVHSSGTEWHKNLPKHPWLKPFIERLFRELNNFLHMLPGATETADIGKKDRTKKAMEEAKITVDQLNKMLQIWRYDSYSKIPRRRVQSPLLSNESPMKCWERHERGALIEAAPGPGEIRQMFFVKSATRALHLEGITFKRLLYSGKNLRKLINDTGVGARLDVRYDPHDVREIAIIHPVTKAQVSVKTKDTKMPPISFDELSEILAQTKPDPEEEISARLVVAQLSLDAVTKSGAKKSVRAAKKNEQKRQRVREISRHAQQSDSVVDGLVDDAQRAPKPLKRPDTLTQMVARS